MSRKKEGACERRKEKGGSQGTPKENIKDIIPAENSFASLKSSNVGQICPGSIANCTTDHYAQKKAPCHHLTMGLK